MAARGRIPDAYGRVVQVPGMMRHGSYPAGRRPGDSLPPPELLEKKFADQEVEIEQLSSDNRKLAATHVALRQDFAASQEEIERVGAHIRSIQTESDIQIRVLLDKIAKMEIDIKAGENVKKELTQARMEAQNLERAKSALSAQIKEATMELDEARANLKRIPEMHAELDNLRQEHQKLRSIFQYEKGLNMEKVEQMHAMERELVGMVREVERLRVEVLNAEKTSHAPNPYGGPYTNPDPFPQPAPLHGSGGYAYAYGGIPAQMGVGVGEGMIPYGSGNSTAPPRGLGSAASPSVGGTGGSVLGGSYDASHAPK